MHSVNLVIPDDVFFEISSRPCKETTINDKLQTRLAIGLFVSQEVSLSKAAQLAGKNLHEFMDTLKNLGIPSINYTEKMLADDLSFASKL
jgi:predicted HTH domain antitoxin